MLITSDSGTGESYRAGLLAERWMAVGYAISVVVGYVRRSPPSFLRPPIAATRRAMLPERLHTWVAEALGRDRETRDLRSRGRLAAHELSLRGIEPVDVSRPDAVGALVQM